MELVTKDLRKMEEERRLNRESIRKNLHGYFSRDIEATTGRPPSPQEVEALVEKTWHSWLRWRRIKSQPRVKSQEQQAAGLGFSSIAECELYLEKVKLGKPLPLKGATLLSAEESREAVGRVSPGYDKSRMVRDFLVELFGARLDQLSDDAKEVVEDLWQEIQVQADGLDVKVARLKKFLKILRSAETGSLHSRSEPPNTNSEDISPKKRSSKSPKPRQ